MPIHRFRALAGALLTLPLLAAAPSASPAPNEVEPSTDRVKAFDALVAETVERFGVAGAAIAVIDDGELVLARGYGYADRVAKAPVTTGTRFNIGSVSKFVSAWGMLKLVDEGRVELDSPVWEYVKTWKLPESKYDASGVTVRRLLSHTAGLSLHGYPGFGLGEELPSLQESLSGATNGAGGVELISIPGSGLRYSGGGFSLLQLMCEELSEKPFAEYMREVCFEPLGMERTGFNRDPKLEKDTAQPHNMAQGLVPDQAFRAEAAAAVYTTLDDFVRFALAHFDLGEGKPAGRGVLGPKTVALFGTTTPDSNGRWAHGSMVIGPGGDQLVIGHAGDNPGWHAQISLQLEGRDGLIVMTNSDAGPALREYLLHPWSALVGMSPTLPAYAPPAAIAVTGLLLDEGGGAAVMEYLRLFEEERGDYTFEPEYLGRLTSDLLSTGGAGDALELLALACDMNPSAARLWALKGTALLELGDKEGARAACQQALSIDAQDPQALAVLAKLK